MAAAATSLTSAGFTLVDGNYGTPTTVTWAAVTYGGGVFVSVALNTATAASSTDGINWTQRSLPANVSWMAVTYGGGLFVAVAQNTTTAATSPDGVTWTIRTMPSAATWQSVTYGNSTYVAISQASTAAATSPDGITWTQRTMSTSQTWMSVTYGAGLFVVVGQATSTVLTSPDGITWTTRTAALPSTSTWSSVTYSGSLFVAVGSTTAAASSPDGLVWTARTLPVSATWAAVTYGGGLFFAVGTSGVGASSPDGTTWTQRTVTPSATWAAVTYGGGVFVATSASVATAASSPDGTTWTQRAMPVVSIQAIADVWKSPAASNQFGQDWYLILRRANDTSNALYYQVAEGYNTSTHRASNLGGTGQAVAPSATTYLNPAVASAPDALATFPTVSMTLTTTAFSYWISATANRLVVGIKTSTEIGFYAGLYDDLLPSGVTQFPLVCARLPINQTNNAPQLGGGTNSSTGGFTREPGQAASSSLNFEAAIHSGFAANASATVIMAANFSPLPTSAALYNNAGAMSRAIIGSQRSVTNYGDAVRGLLNAVFVSGVTSIAGDTITTGGKTYVRFGGPATTHGFFIDSSL